MSGTGAEDSEQDWRLEAELAVPDAVAVPAELMARLRGRHVAKEIEGRRRTW